MKYLSTAARYWNNWLDFLLDVFLKLVDILHLDIFKHVEDFQPYDNDYDDLTYTSTYTSSTSSASSSVTSLSLPLVANGCVCRTYDDVTVTGK